MANRKAKIETKDAGMMMVITYLVLFVVNSLVVFLANQWFGDQVVLGTLHITRGWALIHSMGTLSLIGTFVVPFVRKLEERQGRMLTSKEWMMGYLVINVIGVWLVSRFAEQMGFGITSWRVAIVLGVVLNLIQGAVMMGLEKTRK